MARCFKCGAALPPRETIFRATLCESCGADLRVCKNCGFYAPGAHWDCHETIPEAVRDKERSNFCEFFSPGDHDAAGGSAKSASTEQARAKFNSLFDDQ